MLRHGKKFKHWINNNSFIDVGFSGQKSTWIKGNNASTQKCAQLNIALCNAEWRTQFQEGSVQHLLQNYSDHLPLLISTRGFAQLSNKPKLFRFQFTWITHAGFCQALQENWPESTAIVLALQSLSKALTTQNEEVFGIYSGGKGNYGLGFKASRGN